MKKKVKENLPFILDKLDELYGVEKEGFYHHEPWQLLLAIMLSAQSTDKQVDEAIPALFDHYRTAASLAAASLDEIEGYIRSVGLYKSKAKNMKECCRQIVEEYGGKVPDTMDGLLTLAGVGRKTANLFLSDAYGIPGVTVDTHVFRVSNRLGLAPGKTPFEVEKGLMQAIPEELWSSAHHWLIWHGRKVCHSQRPGCDVCTLAPYCPYFAKTKGGLTAENAP